MTMISQQTIERCVKVVSQDFKKPDLLVIEAVVRSTFILHRGLSPEDIIKSSIIAYKTIVETNE